MQKNNINVKYQQNKINRQYAKMLDEKLFDQSVDYLQEFANKIENKYKSSGREGTYIKIDADNL